MLNSRTIVNWSLAIATNSISISLSPSLPSPPRCVSCLSRCLFGNMWQIELFASTYKVLGRYSRYSLRIYFISIRDADCILINAAPDHGPPPSPILKKVATNPFDWIKSVAHEKLKESFNNSICGGFLSVPPSLSLSLSISVSASVSGCSCLLNC